MTKLSSFGFVLALPLLLSACATEVEPQISEPETLSIVEEIKAPCRRDMAETKKRVQEYLLRGYRRGKENTAEIVRSAFDIGKTLDIDPLLILAVVAVESGLNPRARSEAGAQGVMQVHIPVHAQQFDQNGKRQSAFGIFLNMQVGSTILKDYISRSGSVEEGLKWYVGARYLKTDGGYAKKVLTEMSRLEYAADGNVLDARKRLRLKLPSPSFESIAGKEKLPYAGVLFSKSEFTVHKTVRTVKPEKTQDEGTPELELN